MAACALFVYVMHFTGCAMTYPNAAHYWFRIAAAQSSLMTVWSLSHALKLQCCCLDTTWWIETCTLPADCKRALPILCPAESLALNTHLLRALISLPEPSTPPVNQQQQQQLPDALKSWLMTWLTILSTTSLANASAAGAVVAAAAARRDLPVLLGALLAPGSRQQQQPAAAGSGDVVLGVDAWLPVVVQAAAGVRGDVGDDEDDDELQQGDDSQSEGERWWQKQSATGQMPRDRDCPGIERHTMKLTLYWGCLQNRGAALWLQHHVSSLPFCQRHVFDTSTVPDSVHAAVLVFGLLAPVYLVGMNHVTGTLQFI
jgi:hypothetical protein